MEENNFNPTVTRETAPENQPPNTATPNLQTPLTVKRSSAHIYVAGIITAIFNFLVNSHIGVMLPFLLSDYIYLPNALAITIAENVIYIMFESIMLAVNFGLGFLCFGNIVGVAKFMGIRTLSTFISNSAGHLFGFIGTLIFNNVYGDYVSANEASDYIFKIAAFIFDVIIMTVLIKKLEAKEAKELYTPHQLYGSDNKKSADAKVIIITSVLTFVIGYLVNMLSLYLSSDYMSTDATDFPQLTITTGPLEGEALYYLTIHPLEILLHMLSFAAFFGVGYLLVKNHDKLISVIGIRAIGFSFSGIFFYVGMMITSIITISATGDNFYSSEYSNIISQAISAINLILGLLFSILLLKYITKKERSAALLRKMFNNTEM